MKDNEKEFWKYLSEKLTSLADKTEFPLSNRTTINLSKEEIDAIAWLTRHYVETEVKIG